MNGPIEVFKWNRKKAFLERKYKDKYAFIGIGNHSINNLYPILDFLNVSLKYIVTKSKKTSDLISKSYSSVICTTEYNQVLNDPEINGIFISANPESHFMLTKTALEKNKNVFVEKPICTSSDELNKLISLTEETQKVCLCGMQKRYSTCSSLIKKKIKKEKIISYTYKFQVGAYPEGNLFWDLFIHPIDLVNFIFGEGEVISVSRTQSGKGQLSVFVQMKHQDVIGSIEISSQYSWIMAKEELSINTEKGVYDMQNHQLLTYTSKPNIICSIPVEKVIPALPQKQYLYNGNSFIPNFQNNQLVSQGYYGEIKTFMDLCENRQNVNLSSPSDLKETYSMIEGLL